jgi:osmotically-inducible protein OsmY
MSLSRTQTLPLPSSGSDDRRADEIIENQIQAELRRSSHPAIRRVTCHFSSGVLILQGQVSSYYLKQIVKSTASYRLEGVTVVRNQVEVVTEEAANPGQ